MRLLLIVEDDSDTRSGLSDFMVAEGYSVCEAADAEEGLQKLRSMKPHLVLLDYGVPSPSDGARFLCSKAADPEVASIPVIVTSGFMHLPEMDGVIAFVPKPFGIEKILTLVRKFAGPPHDPAQDA
jgi:CheY-like chemotaxis protein